LWLSACGTQQKSQTSTEPPPGAQQQAETKRYELKGKVVSIDSSGKQMVVDHQAIPGFMDAMAMPYAVKDPASLAAVKAGDQITASVLVSNEGVVLDQIKVAPRAAEK